MPTEILTARTVRARSLLAARAARVTRIRRTVVAVAVAAFVLFWAVIVADGSMGAQTTTSSTSPLADASGATTSGSGSISTPSQDSTSGGQSGWGGSSQPAPVQTGQS